MRPIGFSTGAVARGDFVAALTRLRSEGIKVVELSALRLQELEPLVQALPDLDLAGFEFVSFHAPSRFSPAEESFVIGQLRRVASLSIPIVVHPDVIFNPYAWQWMESMLFIENMDKRSFVGQTVRDLQGIFRQFPDAKFCCDIGHARQVDPTMIEARLILEAFKYRLAEIHISDVNSSSRHDPLSVYSMNAFGLVSDLIPEAVPVVLETLIDDGQSTIQAEIERARRALEPTRVLVPR